MNTHNIGYSIDIVAFQQGKQKWETAIVNYNGPDPLDLWYNFICWYEQNAQYDPERLLETALGKCLSIFEYQQHYHQDTRIVKLWMKYIDLKSNPLNLYQVLYQRGIGTQCAIFYIGWAHYYDAANAFKQAESVYNLGFQAKAQPMHDLEEAHKRFRLSISQRMLYDDQQSKKRTVSHLNDQRQQITALKPSNPSAAAASPCPAPSNCTSFTSPADEAAQPNKRFRAHSATPYSRPSNVQYAPAATEYSNGNSTSNSNFSEVAMPKAVNTSAAHAIASSLNSVYGDGDETISNGFESNYSYTNGQLAPDAANTFEASERVHGISASSEAPAGIKLPPDFVRSAKNHHEPWAGALFLAEPDEYKMVKYPRHQVYPGNGCEYSPEEIRARNYTQTIESIKERNRHRERALGEQRYLAQMHAEQERQHREQQQQHREQEQHQMQRENEQRQMEMQRMKAAAAYEAHRQQSNEEQQHYYRPAASGYDFQGFPPSAARQAVTQIYQHTTVVSTQYNQPEQPQQPPAPQAQQAYNQPEYGTGSPLQSLHSMSYQYQQDHRTQYQPPPQMEPPSPEPPQKPAPQPYINEYQTLAPPQLPQIDNNHGGEDIEDQIEASTIVLDNGQSKPQKITIKFRKENSTMTATTSITDTVPSQTILESQTPKSVRKSKKSKSKSNGSSKVVRSDYDSETQGDLGLSNDSMASATSFKDAKSKGRKSTTRAKCRRQEPAFLENEESFSNSEFTAIYRNYNPIDEDAENSNGAPQTLGSAVRFSFSGATSTPIRNNNNSQQPNLYVSPCASAKPTDRSNESSSKSCTPRSTYKNLRRRTSNVSLHRTIIENDDSMTSFSMVEPNSFFEAENDDELRQQRLDKALKTIDQHFERPHIDPFHSELCKAFLTKIGFPSREHSNRYQLSSTILNKLTNTKSTCIGEQRFNIEKEIGRGAYGNVYRANTHSGEVVALKYQKPPNTWELYICNEVAKKIKDRNMVLGFMDISSAVIAPNASIFVTEFSQYGSLLDVNNRVRQATTKVMHESLVMHFTSQILNIVHHLHSCQIIHADIKPDNFLLMRVPSTNAISPTIRLIDFGCAIDMSFFEPGAQFTKIIQTDGFTCPEMLDRRPWSYQTDIFCIAGTVHVMLFGEYMQMAKKFDQYEIKQKLPRYLKKHVWTEFFSKFLNIKDSMHLPNLLEMKEKIDGEVYNMESELQSQIRTLSNILHKR